MAQCSVAAPCLVPVPLFLVHPGSCQLFTSPQSIRSSHPEASSKQVRTTEKYFLLSSASDTIRCDCEPRPCAAASRISLYPDRLLARKTASLLCTRWTHRVCRSDLTARSPRTLRPCAPAVCRVARCRALPEVDD
ncbi:uncharacterized protein CCOS01_16179 [Colletotrichum costaricense]|uniref:Uncharacterized protein n=1 Tax=Colletotrichum costaricense TaxID=1209916 RepID=A0AAI9YFV5_9PEZI|nr:uncharacterized protein CCOS01_16179 [Colletotrichum costaricense]KAK1507873.1 hypothetical protein CCOS01_16179 [Colletotrichum costaricense]